MRNSLMAEIIENHSAINGRANDGALFGAWNLFECMFSIDYVSNKLF